MAAIAVWAPAAIRPRTEDIHDLTTSLETDVPQTATRVFVLYKVNNAFARGGDPTHVRRRLPLRRAGEPGAARSCRSAARRDGKCSSACATCSAIPTDAGSIYDELLVVRPPKRVIGGVLIRF